ncbi:MAG: hypothetical protein QXU92_01625 [Candidatus Diapherotrites archaeon]
MPAKKPSFNTPYGKWPRKTPLSRSRLVERILNMSQQEVVRFLRTKFPRILSVDIKTILGFLTEIRSLTKELRNTKNNKLRTAIITSQLNDAKSKLVMFLIDLQTNSNVRKKR